jgi:hypothetical protein
MLAATARGEARPPRRQTPRDAGAGVGPRVRRDGLPPRAARRAQAGRVPGVEEGEERLGHARDEVLEVGLGGGGGGGVGQRGLLGRARGRRRHDGRGETGAVGGRACTGPRGAGDLRARAESETGSKLWGLGSTKGENRGRRGRHTPLSLHAPLVPPRRPPLVTHTRPPPSRSCDSQDRVAPAVGGAAPPAAWGPLPSSSPRRPPSSGRALSPSATLPHLPRPADHHGPRESRRARGERRARLRLRLRRRRLPIPSTKDAAAAPRRPRPADTRAALAGRPCSTSRCRGPRPGALERPSRRRRLAHPRRRATARLQRATPSPSGTTSIRRPSSPQARSSCAPASPARTVRFPARRRCSTPQAPSSPLPPQSRPDSPPRGGRRGGPVAATTSP